VRKLTIIHLIISKEKEYLFKRFEIKPAIEYRRPAKRDTSGAADGAISEVDVHPALQ
jgi:hypothetical protein